MAKPRVLLADDHNLVADALGVLLRQEFEVVGIASDGRALLELALSREADIVVSDVFMPQLNGLDATRMIRAEHPSVRVVLLSMNPAPEVAAAAFRAGASGYLLKSSAGTELVECLKTVFQGGTYLTRAISRGDFGALMLQNPDQEPPAALSARESEVLQLLAEGNSMKEVAGVLGISARTVQFHKYRIMERFRLKSGAELVQFALKRRMIS